ncbi:MAG: hypothetical protein ABL904_02500, partial [Hyphomicrobiaceae bacterium]
GAAIGAVKRDPARHEHYLIRGELFEFLSTTAKKAFEGDKEKGRLADLERNIGVALLRDVPTNVQIMQDALHPMNEDRGFSAEVRLKEAHPQAVSVIRKVLNAGAAFGVVQRVGTDPTHFFIHRDMVRTLSNIQARLMMSGAYDQVRVSGPNHGQARQGGQMQDYRAPIAVEPMPARIAAQPKPPTEDELRQFYVDNLLEAIGLKPEIYAVVAGPAVGAAVGATNAFAQVRARNSTLDHYLTARDQAARKAFFEAYSLMQGRIADHDERRIEILNDAHDELDSKWSALMLMPQGPFQSLIEDLLAGLETQAGAGKLSVHETELHRLLKNLKAQLSSARTTAEDWHHLERAFQIDAGESDKLVVFQQKAHSGQR